MFFAFDEIRGEVDWNIANYIIFKIIKMNTHIHTSMHKINVGSSVYYKVWKKFTCGLFFLSRSSLFFLSLAIKKTFVYELSYITPNALHNRLVSLTQCSKHQLKVYEPAFIYPYTQMDNISQIFLPRNTSWIKQRNYRQNFYFRRKCPECYYQSEYVGR